MIDVETARVASMGVAYSPLGSMGNMTKAANEIVGKLLGGEARATASAGSASQQQATSSATPQPPAAQPHSPPPQQSGIQQNNSATGAQVLINTMPPDAAIHIGGKIVGRSNSGMFTDVPIGTHEVTFVKDGIRYATTMTFEPGLNRNKILHLGEPKPTNPQPTQPAQLAQPAQTTEDWGSGNQLQVTNSATSQPPAILPHYSQQTAQSSVYSTDGRRTAAMLLNMFTIPGLGSAAVMKDWDGFWTTWTFMGVGAMFMFVGVGVENVVPIWVGIATIGVGGIYNIARPWTYKENVPKTALNNNLSDGLKFAVIPDKNGGYKTVVAYNLSF
jgi:hypothetical protein